MPSPIFAAPSAPLTITLQDEDPAPNLILETVPLNESAAGTDRLVARLSRPSEKTVSAQLTFAGGSALAGQDFRAEPITLTFAPGQIELPIAIELIDDGVFELEETFAILLSDPVEVRLPKAEVPITIFDNDPQPVISLSAPSIAEGER